MAQSIIKIEESSVEVNIDYSNIKIDARIVNMGDLNIQMGGGEEDPASPDFGEDNPEKLKAKRRIINGITQGASIRGAFGFLLFNFVYDNTYNYYNVLYSCRVSTHSHSPLNKGYESFVNTI